MSTSIWKSNLSFSGSILRAIACKMFNALYFIGKQYETSVNEVLFYGAEDEDRMRQKGLNNLLCIFYVIIHASRSIDVCVPSLDSDTMAKCLIGAQHKNKTKIRIIIHSSDSFHNLQSFAQNGIEVKLLKSAERIEHEFILIDAEETDSVAVIGSLDYETTQVNCNRDATILTTEATVVQTLNREFNRIWSVVEITHDKLETK